MVNKESIFAGLHILMPAIPDGPEDTGRRLHRYWYRGSRCQVHTGWQIQNPFNLRNPLLKSVKSVFYKALFWSFYVSFCTFCASLRLTKTVFRWLMKKAVSMALCTKASLCVKSSLLEQSLPRTPSRPKTSVSSVPSVAKNLFNLRNPRLINDLRAFKLLYNCRETFTDVMSALQIRLFMQNKPNFRKSQMNVTKVLTREYDKKDTWWSGKKQSQTNPNKAKFKMAKMNVNKVLTKDYKNNSNWTLGENKAKLRNDKNLCNPLCHKGL